MKEHPQMQITGHVLIKDAETDQVLVDAYNAINFENASVSLAQSWAKQVTLGPIHRMVFGNGAASMSGVGTVTYLTPNTVGSSATLYNQTYSKIVNDQDTNNTDITKNNIVVSHQNGNLFTDVIVSCVLTYGEPSGQNATDNAANLSQPFVFNELGLVSYSGQLLSHIAFSPIEKSTNRAYAISYTLRLQMI